MVTEPKRAAACVLVRGQNEPEVLLVQRNNTLRFMAGHHVFPGGRLQEDENASAVVNAGSPEMAQTVLAVAREVFEETGLLCVRDRPPAVATTRAARRRLLAGELNFADFLTLESLTIDAQDFLPAGIWVTPEFSPIRFATHYFLHYVRHDQVAELVEGEIVGLDWLTAAEARARWHRGELRISTPVAYTLRQLAAAGLPAALQLLARGTERVPGEHNWFEIRRGITLIPLKSATLPPATHTNCLIIGEQELIVIDPGSDDPAEQLHLVRQLDHLCDLGGRVVAIVLSHSHRDHVAGAEALRKRYSAPMLAHAATAAQLSISIDRELVDNEILTSGRDPQWRLRCIHTPGHDPGHLCFFEESTGTLLAGDMVANPGTIVVSRAYGGDMGEFMSSLERIAALPAKLLIPAHGHPAGSPGDFLKKHLAHRQWREERIRQAYAAGAKTFDELLAASYEDAPPAALPIARHSLDAHLHKLGITVCGAGVSKL